MRLPFKQQVVINGVVVWEVVKHEYTVGERSSVLVFTPELDNRRVYREYVDLGNGYGAWKKLYTGMDLRL
jgi:hypothetical protein